MAAGSGSDDAWELLHGAREAIGPVLRNAVTELPEPVRKVARYHFGCQDAAGDPTQGGWGKGVRGALALASAQACGGSVDSAVRVAAGVELVHNFALLHDDLIDSDYIRRGRLTAWAVFGDARAVLAGDALLVLAVKMLIAEQSCGLPPAAVQEMSDALLGLLGGQSADLAFDTRDDVRLADSLRMAGGKTASLFAAACALGSMTAHAGTEQICGMRAFGHHVGLAFQLTDDMLGIWGKSGALGKVVGTDLRRHKKSFPVVAALSSDTGAGRRLAELYNRPQPLTDAETRRATLLIEEAGGLEGTRQEAARHHDLALGRLASVLPELEGERKLVSLADMAVHRQA